MLVPSNRLRPGVSAGCVTHVVPDTVNGLPLHALSVHATVVLVPLLALLGVVYAVPRLRAWARWPLGLLALAAAGSTWVSVQSGNHFQDNLDGRGALTGAFADAVDRHAELAGQLQWMVYGYAILALVAVFLVRARTSAGSAGDGPDAGKRPVQRSDIGSSDAVAIGLSVLLVLGAVAVGVQVARVGDAGSKAVWNPDPENQIDYSTGD